MKKLILILAIVVISEASVADSFKLRDYDEAVRTNNIQKIMFLRSYILGAVETHLLYSTLLRNWTSVNVLCTGHGDLNMNELGKVFEVKILMLRRKYGEDIMDMPMARAVQMMVEEQFTCD